MQNKIFIFFLSFFVLASWLTAQTNEGFEQTPLGSYTTSTGVTGWTISSQTATSCVTSSVWAPGSPEFSVMATPNLSGYIFNNYSFPTYLYNSQFPGNHVARLNDLSATGLRTRARQTFSVTAANTLFEWAFGGMWEDGGHLCCEQAHVKFNLYDCSGNLIPYWSKSYNANGTSCTNGATGFSLTTGWTWTGWQFEWIDLTAYMGSCVTVELISGDCIYGTHAGMTYFDAYVRPPLLYWTALNGQPLTTYSGTYNFCPGSNLAQISAPLGYAAYQWFAPNSLNQPIPIGSLNGGNTPVVTINNPTAGVIYTVQLTATNGFTFVQIDTLQYSSVSISGVGTYSSCPGGASGSASVLCSGSATGYNYTWKNSGNTVVSTNSYAANLIPGVYSVTTSALGSPGCGSVVTTVTVGLGPPNINTFITPFCAGQTRTLIAPPGTNRHWYNGTVAIAAALGGTASTLTVPTPTTGQFFWLAYLDPQGCQDSLKFLLSQTPAGSITISGNPYACPNASNAAMSLTLIPASGSPPGSNSFNVFSTSGPAYSSSITNYAQNVFIANGLTAGNYSVIAFDGSCQYTSTFVINTYSNNYVVNGNTVCVGSQAIVGISFTTAIVPGQYNFLWSPAANIVGGALNATNISIQTAPIVTSTAGINVYTVTVTPTLVNCPITKTLSVTSITLPTPVISSAIQPFCNNLQSNTITALPTGGTFTTGSGAWLNSSTGQITPVLLSAGTHTFIYSLISGNCISSVSGSFSVIQFNSAALTTPTMSLCDNLTNCVNLLGVTQNSAGTWSGVGVLANQFCPLNAAPGLHTLTYINYSTPNATLCPDVQTMSVIIVASAIQGISTPPAFCSNAAPFTMPISTSGGTWTSPAPLFLNAGGGVTPANAPGGIVTLTYTGICGNTETVNITTGIFHPATLTGSFNSLCVNSSSVNLMSIVASTVNGSWTGTGVANNVFTPTVAAGIYTVQYNTTSSNPPLCPDQSSLAIYVYNAPTLSVQANTAICKGQTVTLPVSGATSYSLNGTAVFPFVVSPSVTTTYTITGSAHNCASQKVVTVQVSPCDGIEEMTNAESFHIYPNPTDGNLYIELQSTAKIILFNEFGQTVLELNLKEGKQSIELNDFKAGIYLLRVMQENKTSVAKIIRTN